MTIKIWEMETLAMVVVRALFSFTLLLCYCGGITCTIAGNFDEIDATKLPLPNSRSFREKHVFNLLPGRSLEIPASCQCRCQLFGDSTGKPSHRHPESNRLVQRAFVRLRQKTRGQYSQGRVHVEAAWEQTAGPAGAHVQRTVDAELRAAGLSWGDAEQQAQDRRCTVVLVKAADSQWMQATSNRSNWKSMGETCPTADLLTKAAILYAYAIFICKITAHHQATLNSSAAREGCYYSAPTSYRIGFTKITQLHVALRGATRSSETLRACVPDGAHSPTSGRAAPRQRGRRAGRRARSGRSSPEGVFRGVITEIERRKWRWAAHIARMDHSRWARRVLEGRPPKRWTDDIRQQAGVNWMRVAMNRQDWKSREEAYVRRRAL
ncbi:hypothetical protein MSG28_010179 [Choristoneura fumiferana]|uniref:Uncharacterized protein n=1 Tax=Choristoneura fumiferana TaxID=7141 RepID=A0ACC0KJG8_CHOFU|nr:hypothetical protein MSG28_010179 [Choristoneura fumiferana]